MTHVIAAFVSGLLSGLAVTYYYKRKIARQKKVLMTTFTSQLSEVFDKHETEVAEIMNRIAALSTVDTKVRVNQYFHGNHFN